MGNSRAQLSFSTGRRERLTMDEHKSKYEICRTKVIKDTSERVWVHAPGRHRKYRTTITCLSLQVVSCSGSSSTVEALFRGLTAATADRSAPLLFWPGFTCTAGFMTDGLTFSLGLTEKERESPSPSSSIFPV